MKIERVGVIGAGQMGNGIAHVFALAGFEVLLHDVSGAALEAAPGIIRGNMDRQVAREQHHPGRARRGDRAHPDRAATSIRSALPISSSRRHREARTSSTRSSGCWRRT